MTNRAKLSLSSEENPNPTPMNLLRDGGVPEQDDAIVIGDLVVTMVDSAEQQWQQMVRPEVAVDRMKVEKLYQNRINGVNRK